MKRLGFKKSVDLSGIDERVGTSESKIANLERTTSDTNKALATAQNQMNARFDNLVVGGRNLLLDSNQNINTHQTKYFYISPNIKLDLIKNLVISCYIHLENGISTNTARFDRLGVEVSITYTDSTKKWVGAWIYPKDTPNYNGRIFYQFNVPQDKTIKSITAYIQILGLEADVKSVSNPKLELGTIPTDWTPAPEDYTAGLTIYNTTTAQSPNVFVSDTGQLQRSTSSERYKNIISPLVLDDKAYKNAMKLNPIIYRSTAEADKQDWHYYSFSAEQLGQFDKAFTLWRTPTETIIDDNGEITITELEPIAEGINLNAIVAFLHATNVKQGMLIRDLTKRIEFLENQRDK